MRRIAEAGVVGDAAVSRFRAVRALALSLAVLFPVPSVEAQTLDQVIGRMIDGSLSQGGGQRRYIDPPVRQRRYIDPPVGTAPRQRSSAAEAREPAMDLAARKRVQAALRRLGFYQGAIDGALGRGSRDAIARYQDSLGAAATGYVTAGQLGVMTASLPDDGPGGGGDDGSGLDRAASGDAGLGAEPAAAEESSIFDDDAADAGPPARRTASGATEGLPSGIPAVETFYDNYGYSDVERRDTADLGHELIRRIVKAEPAVLDNEKQLSGWLTDYAYGNWALHPTRQVLALYETYKSGTEFEQAEALSAFRAILAAEATDAPLTLVRVRLAPVGRYDFDRGYFPLAVKDDSYGLSSEMFVQGGGRSGTTALAERWQTIDRLPFPKARAQALAKRLEATNVRGVDVAVRMTLKDFAPSASASATGIAATAVVEGVTMHLRDRPDGARLGTLVATLPLDAPENSLAAEAKPAASALESWTRLGATAAQGALAAGPSLTGDDGDTGLLRPLLLLALARSPGIVEDIDILHGYAKTFLSEPQYRSLFPRGYTYQASRDLAQDVFLKRDLVERFAAGFRPSLTARAPRFPVPMTLGWPVDLGPYDFDKGAFPLQNGVNGSVEHGTLKIRPYVSSGPELEFVTDMSGLPGVLTLDEAKARVLTAALRKANGASSSGMRLYASFAFDLGNAVDMTVKANSSGDPRSAPLGFQGKLAASASRLALYADPQLKRLVSEVDLDPLRPKPAEPAPAEPKPGEALGPQTLLGSLNILAIGRTIGLDEAFTDRVLKGARSYGDANEFERDAALAALRSKMAAALPKPKEPVFLAGTVTLGEYDAGKAAFRVGEVGFATVDPENLGLYGRFVTIGTENPDALLALPSTAQAAERLVALNPGRKFPARFRVRPVRAAVPATNGSGPQMRLDVLVEEVLLLAPQDESRVLARSRIDAGKLVAEVPALASPDGVRLAVRPAVVPLNEETLALFVLRESGKAPDEPALRWLLARRWEAENRPTMGLGSPMPAPFGRFFPESYRQLDDADVGRLLPSFRKWTALRIAALPTQVRFDDVIGDYSSMESGFAGSMSTYKPVLERLGITPKQYAMPRMGGPLETRTVEGKGAVLSGGLVGLEWNTVSSSYPLGLFILPELQVPAAVGANPKGVSIDMTIRRIEASAEDGTGGYPFLAFDVSAGEVRWYGQPASGSDPYPLLAKSEAPPSPERVPAKEAPMDIVGLRLGMPREEAEALIAAHMTVGRILELKGDASTPNAVAENARLYVDAEGGDYLAILYGPAALAPKVYGVTRTLHMPAGSATQGQLLGALVGKYGETASTNDWKWGRTATEYRCASPGDPTQLDWRGASVIKGDPVSMALFGSGQAAPEGNLAREALIMRRMAGLEFGLGIPGAPQNKCGPTISASAGDYTAGFAGETIPGAATIRLVTRLVDHDAHQAALNEGAKAAENVPPPPPPADLKL